MFKLKQVVKIDGHTIGTIKELPSDYDKRYLIEIGCDLRRIDDIRIKHISPGTGNINKGCNRNG